MDPGDLLLLDSILTQGGLSAASVSLGLPKTTLSRRLRELERAAGAPLFERVGRRLRPTSLGLALALPASNVRTAVAAAEALARSQADADQGRLSIVSPVLFGLRVLTPFLADFAAARPNLGVSLVFSQTPVDPLRDAVDIAFSVQRPEAPYLIVRRMKDYGLALYAAPDKAQAIAQPDDLAAVCAVQIANLPSSSTDMTLSDGLVSRQIQLRVRATVNDPAAGAELAAAGLGVVALPSFVADSYVAQGRLRTVLPGMCTDRVAIYAAMPPLRNRIPVVRAFLSDLSRALAR